MGNTFCHKVLDFSIYCKNILANFMHGLSFVSLVITSSVFLNFVDGLNVSIHYMKVYIISLLKK